MKPDTASRVTTVHKVATRYQQKKAAKAPPRDKLIPLLEDMLKELKKFEAWSKGFPNALRAAQRDSEGLPPGYLWQDEFVEYWKPFEKIERALYDAHYDVDFIILDNPDLESISYWISPDPPQKARIEHVMDSMKFFPDPRKGGKNHIAYEEKAALEWHQNFTRWVSETIRNIRKAISKAKRKV